MRRLIAFNHMSLDGYFTSASGDFRWAHAGNDDPEYQSFVKENASGGGELLFGRVTYELMASYWPTPMAKQHDAAVAEAMNRMSKVVFSRKLDQVSWSNTRLVRDDLASAVRQMKQAEGPGMAILGSGSIIAQLAAENLIDEYQVVVDPVVLGGGRTMFNGLPAPLSLSLLRTRVFRNGKVFLAYEPVHA